MKWLVISLVFSLTVLVSCGGIKNKNEEKPKATKAAHIKVKDLEEPCEYADALLIVYQEASGKVDIMVDRVRKMKALLEKLNTIMDHGDKSLVDKSGFKKCAAYSEFKKLSSEIERMGDIKYAIKNHEDDFGDYIKDEYGITKDEYKGDKTEKALKSTNDNLVEPCDYVDAMVPIFEALSIEMKSVIYILGELKLLDNLEVKISESIDDSNVKKPEVENCESFKKGKKLQDEMEDKLEEFEVMFESAF